MRLVPIGDSGPVNYMPDYPDTIKVQGRNTGGKATGFFNGWIVL